MTQTADATVAPVTAAAASERKLAPIDWYRNPKLDGPTPVTVTPEGRVYGHIATWDQDHIGMPGQRVRPPRSGTDYRWFHRGYADVLGDDGQPTKISAGNLTADIGHAPLSAGGKATDAHYDNAQAIVARVNAGEDHHGIWFAGELRPDLDEFTRWRLSSCGLSGDWRAADSGEGYNGLELRAALFVPCGGFPIPRARVASGAPAVEIDLAVDRPMALVAAGALPPSDFDPKEIIVTVQPTATEAPAEPTEATEPESVTAAAAPVFVKDQVVKLPSTLGPALVASVDGDTAVVTVEVPLSELQDAGPEGRAALSASAKDKLRDNQLNDAIAEITKLREEVQTVVASAAEREQAAEAKARGAEALSALADVPGAEAVAAGN